MASKKRGMSDAELSALVRSQIYDAIGYDQTELSIRREKAIEYYRGDLEDLPSGEGRSSVTTRDLSDHAGWILPGLMRVFAGSEHVVSYEPQTPGDEQFAQQATDYVNYVFFRECQGYRVLRDAFQDALLFGNGIWKFWWDDTPEYETLDYTGLSEEAFIALVADDDVEVLQHTEEVKTETVTDPQTGQPVQQEYICHDLKIQKVCSKGRLKIVCIPPEEFLIERGATSIEDAKFVCHRSERTRQSLIDDGYDRDDVMAIGPEYGLEATPERIARWDEIVDGDEDSTSDPLMVEVEVYEAYARVDYDGDGYAEWRKVVLAGNGDQRKVLANDEWSDDVPFADAVPMPDAHIWRGRSLLDDLEDIQKVKTQLLRQTLDNLYLSNTPQREALQNAVLNPDEMVNPTLGGTIWVKQAGATREIATPFVADKSYAMLAYQDEMAEKRTGVSRQSMALDPEALQGQTATGQMLAQTASYAKVELFARNMAELGLKRLFRCILKLIVRHQDRPRMVRLRDQWVPMDPRSWNANMDANVSVGLGSGSRDRDMAILTQIAAKQEQILQQMGPMNPVCDLMQYASTLRKLVEAAGLRTPDDYFKEVNPQDIQQLMKQQGQKQDPKVQAEMEKIYLARQKAQMEAQLDQQKAQTQLAADREEAALELQLKREEAAAELQLEREKAEFDRRQKEQDALLDAQLRRDEMVLEAELTREANAMNAAIQQRQADTNIKRRERTS